MTLPFIIFPLLLAVPCAALQPDDGELLPPSNHVKGWSKVATAKVFTSSDLYGYINGGAEIFLEYGFEQLTVQRYRQGDEEEVTMEIYRMVDPIASRGIYLMKCGTESSDRRLNAIHTIHPYQMLMCRGRYYFQLTNQTGAERLRQVMLDFARYCVDHLPDDPELPLLDSLPEKNLIPRSIRLFRGPYALQSYNPLGDENMFLLGRSTIGVGGEYKDEQSRSYTMIRVRYSDPATAIMAFNTIRSRRDASVTVTETGEGYFIFRDYSNRFGIVRREHETLELRCNLIEQPHIQEE